MANQEPRGIGDFFESLAHTSADGLLVIDKEGIVQYANPKAISMFSEHVRNLVGFHFGIPAVQEPIELQLPRHAEIHYVEMRASEFSWNGRESIFASLRDITEIKRAYNLLQQERDRAQLYLDTVRVVVLGLDVEGRIELLNLHGLTILGYKQETVLGMNWFDLVIPPDERNRVRKSYERLLSGDQNTDDNIEYHVTTAENEQRILAWHTVVLRDTEGNPTGILSSGEDVTEKRKVESALLKSEVLLNETGHMARVGGWEIDTTTQEVTWTETTRAIHEVSEDFKPNLEQALNFFEPEAREKLSDAISKAVKLGIQYDLVLPFVSAKGRRLWTHTVGKPVFENGTCILLRGMFQDITEQRQAESALRSSEERYRRLAENSPAVIFQLRMTKLGDFTFTFITKSVQRVLGVPAEAVMRDVGVIQHVIDHNQQKEIADALRESNQHKTPVQLEINILRDGQRAWVQANATPEQQADGSVLWDGFLYDITDQRIAEEKLRQSQKLEAIGQLAGGVAHDFNNLLTGIMGYASIAQEEISETTPTYQWLSKIITEAERSAKIVHQLLGFARKQPIKPRILDLNNAIAEMLNMLQRLIGENIDLVWKPCETLWPVKIDPSQLNQILVNLCINSRDAIAGVGNITIRTENVELKDKPLVNSYETVSGSFVMIEVSDTGAGMDVETQRHVFDPFFTTKRYGEGTGLGLATVHGIVKQNNGTISMSSELGKGTSFRFYLPPTEIAQESSDDSPAESMAPGGPETILLVEDEQSVRFITESFLKLSGYAVLTAATGKQALQLFEDHKEAILLVITDVIMPEMSGLELVKKISEEKSDMKILYISGYPANIIGKSEVLDDSIEFLRKPFSRNELLFKVRQILDS